MLWFQTQSTRIERHSCSRTFTYLRPPHRYGEWTDDRMTEIACLILARHIPEFDLQSIVASDTTSSCTYYARYSYCIVAFTAGVTRYRCHLTALLQLPVGGARALLNVAAQLNSREYLANQASTRHRASQARKAAGVCRAQVTHHDVM